MLVLQNFIVPENVILDDFYLEVLSPKYAELDYEAVMSSRERLRKVFENNDTWPRDDMTFEENRNDLVRHEKEFFEKKAFAYSVLSIDKKDYMGCVYIDPPTSQKYDSEIYFWVSEREKKHDENLYNSVRKWINDYWPFSNPCFPGRDSDWTLRNKLKNI